MSTPDNSRSAPAAASATAVPQSAGNDPARPGRSENSKGLLFGIGAYGIWGMLPLFFIILLPAGAVEIVANRIVWSLAFCALLLTVNRSWPAMAAALRDIRILSTLALAAALIAANWLIYTWSVTNGHAIEASLGYFINPLLSVLLGVIILREKLRALQWTAVGIGAAAVVVLAFAYGQLPWESLGLALSFGLYGFVKKRVGPRVDAITSLSVETAVLAPIAGAVMIYLAATGAATLGSEGAGHFWLMASSGIVTAVPLVLFGAAARRLPLTSIGLLQFMTPILQFILATTVLHEHMPLERWAGFALVWVALLVLTVDMLRAYRRNRRLRGRAAPPVRPA